MSTNTSVELDSGGLLGEITHFQHRVFGVWHQACTGELVGEKPPAHAITCAVCIEHGQAKTCACGATNIVVTWP